MERPVKLEKRSRILLALVLIAFLLTGGGSAVYGYRHYTEQREKYFQTLRQTEREAAANAAFFLGEVLRPYRELVFITATRLTKMNLDDDAGIDQFLTEKVIKPPREDPSPSGGGMKAAAKFCGKIKAKNTNIAKDLLCN